jgi:hypothetical protein
VPKFESVTEVGKYKVVIKATGPDFLTAADAGAAASLAAKKSLRDALKPTPAEADKP